MTIRLVLPGHVLFLGGCPACPGGVYKILQMSGVLCSVYFIFASQTIAFTIHTRSMVHLETHTEPRNVYSFIIKQCSASVLSAALPLRSVLLGKSTDATHACTVCRWATEKGNANALLQTDEEKVQKRVERGSRVFCLQSWDVCVRGKLTTYKTISPL